jgi:hypothetical protein
MSQTVAGLDAKLRQAAMPHQTRRLAEAEINYRQIWHRGRTWSRFA